MIHIRPASQADIPALCALARLIWPATYTGVISQQQIEYMLADRYAPEQISLQIADPRHAWRLAYWENDFAGFAHARLESEGGKLDKLYVHPNSQRRGIGRALTEDIKIFARTHRAARLYLQVNRQNTAAISAYLRYGFTIIQAQMFDIGGGFVMDDYVMEAPI